MLMKKSNKVLVGCLSLLLVMAVGYALFSDTITINGTATAKGEFDVAVTCVPGINTLDNDVKSLVIENLGIESGYKNDSCTVTGNNISYNSELEYPGATRFFTVKVTNNGTMNVVYNMKSGVELVDHKFCMDGLNEVRPNIRIGQQDDTITNDECFFEDESEFIMNIITESHYKDLLIYQFEKADKTIVSIDSEDIDEFYNGDTDDITLKPGESFYTIIYTTFPDFTLIKQDLTSSMMYEQVTQKFTFSQQMAN